MSTLIPALLRPLRRQQYRLSTGMPSGVPRPYDAPQAHAHGDNPDRILVFGNGVAAGWGVASHELALPGQLARTLSRRTGRGADVDVLADTAWDIETAADVLAGRDLRGYDAVVVVMGASDAYRFLPAERWAAGLVRLLETLERETSSATGITMMGIQPISTIPTFHSKPGGMGDRWARRLNRLSFAICEGRSRAHFIEAPESVGPLRGQTSPTLDDQRYRSPERFRQWAVVQAAFIAPFLDAQSASDRPARVARNQPQSSARRRAALWEMRLLDTPDEKRFDDIVRHAQSMFGTHGAAFTVIDENRQWNKSVAGFDDRELPLEQSFCTVTIRSADALVIEDSWKDDRAPEGSPMRFYAGYPVEASNGTRIGALCVFDEDPRSAASVDVSLLRDLAHAIQRELEPVRV